MVSLACEKSAFWTWPQHETSCLHDAPRSWPSAQVVASTFVIPVISGHRPQLAHRPHNTHPVVQRYITENSSGLCHSSHVVLDTLKRKWEGKKIVRSQGLWTPQKVVQHKCNFWHAPSCGFPAVLPPIPDSSQRSIFISCHIWFQFIHSSSVSHLPLLQLLAICCHDISKDYFANIVIRPTSIISLQLPYFFWTRHYKYLLHITMAGKPEVVFFHEGSLGPTLWITCHALIKIYYILTLPLFSS